MQAMENHSIFPGPMGYGETFSNQLNLRCVSKILCIAAMDSASNINNSYYIPIHLKLLVTYCFVGRLLRMWHQKASKAALGTSRHSNEVSPHSKYSVSSLKDTVFMENITQAILGWEKIGLVGGLDINCVSSKAQTCLLVDWIRSTYLTMSIERKMTGYGFDPASKCKKRNLSAELLVKSYLE